MNNIKKNFLKSQENIIRKIKKNIRNIIRNIFKKTKLRINKKQKNMPAMPANIIIKTEKK